MTSNRKEFVIRVGPILKSVLDNQKKNVKDVSYDCVNISDYDAGEIIGKKITKSNLV
jgi:cellobiose-specific phosphotransferase system component IIB